LLSARPIYRVLNIAVCKTDLSRPEHCRLQDRFIAPWKLPSARPIYRAPTIDAKAALLSQPTHTNWVAVRWRAHLAFAMQDFAWNSNFLFRTAVREGGNSAKISVCCTGL